MNNPRVWKSTALALENREVYLTQCCRKSSPPQKRQLIVFISNSKLFRGEVDRLKPLDYDQAVLCAHHHAKLV